MIIDIRPFGINDTLTIFITLVESLSTRKNQFLYSSILTKLFEIFVYTMVTL